MNQLRFKQLHPDAILPTRANYGDAGLDLYSLEDVTIPAAELTKHVPSRVDYDKEGDAIVFPPHDYVSVGAAKVATGIAVEIPYGYWGEIKSRSGLGFKHGIEVGAGTIDAGYREGIKVKLYNFTDQPYQIKKGDRIAQIVIQKCELLEPIFVDELSPAERGDKGFGASGR